MKNIIKDCIREITYYKKRFIIIFIIMLLSSFVFIIHNYNILNVKLLKADDSIITITNNAYFDYDDINNISNIKNVKDVKYQKNINLKAKVNQKN